jgi:hypothetical protein
MIDNWVVRNGGKLIVAGAVVGGFLGFLIRYTIYLVTGT